MSVYPHEACDLSRESDSLRKCVVNLNNPLPRYYQVYFPLLAQFHAGKFKPGNPLPSERQLAQDHGITHITIIKAKDLPRRGNLIEHHAGRRSLVLRQDESPAGRASLKGWPEGTAVIAPPIRPGERCQPACDAAHPVAPGLLRQGVQGLTCKGVKTQDDGDTNED